MNIGISNKIRNLPVGEHAVLRYNRKEYTVSRDGENSYSVTTKSENSSDIITICSGALDEFIECLKKNNMI